MITYNREPLSWMDGIPVFARDTEYAETYEQIASDHLRHLAAHGRSPFMEGEQIEASNASTADLVRKYVRTGSRILDGGVGMGELWKGFVDYEIHGVDLATEYLKVANSNGVQVAKAQIADLPFETDTFDAITVCDVLEHLIDIDRSVRELSRVLRPNGYFIVRVPNNEDLSSYIAEPQYKYTHVRSFTESSLRLYMEKCFGYFFLEAGYSATGFYSSAQLINPSVPRDSELRRILPFLQRQLTENAGAMPPAVGLAYATLSRSLAVSLEEQVDALITIRDQAHTDFAKLSCSMLRPAELLAVFRRQK
ncbi:MAG: class I SAM-dependent methyltransferase [Pseudolabrys sp.]|nr:class I SAM-dependent methyltransferase [Pseudolabrys sp.]